MNAIELLPVGTVVRVKDFEHAVMIYGIKQTHFQTNKEMDYIGVPYPEGYMGMDVQHLFNHSDINEVLFMGYETEERKVFLGQLDDYLKRQG